MRFKGTSVAEFEGFFNGEYTDKILEFSSKYPDEKSFIINYNELKLFSQYLADLLIDCPNEVIEAAQIAIKNIMGLDDNSRIIIRFENLPKIIPLDSARSEYMGKFVSIDGIIKKVEEPYMRLGTALFECPACYKLYEVEQNNNNLIEPSLCIECGGRSFRLLYDESKYIDVQKLIIGMDMGHNKTSRELLIFLEDDLISQDGYKVGQHIRFTGVLNSYSTNNSKLDTYLKCNNIERLPDMMVDYDDEDVSEEEYGARDSPEYKAWRNEILNRDKVCQCCGSEKEPVAHHIFGYEDHPEYRVHGDNGIRLCKWCHGKYHSHYGIRHANPLTFIEFIQRFGSIRK
ncbi:hypothetical protein [Methanobrevibacter sp.]|uniref:hypothetical protein n=1 Tax=Methanobrevibacter sp. TaxID=66852 RepID=UPI00386F369E